MLDLGIAGKTAIVCGSSRGLGRASAEALARAGVTVVVNGIDAQRVERTATEIARATNGRTIPVAGDVTTREGQDKLFAAMPEPASWMLLLCGLVILGFMARRRLDGDWPAA